MADKEKYLLSLAIKYYSKSDLVHALTVADYTRKYIVHDAQFTDSLWIVGLCHDLLEDTDCTAEELNCILSPKEYEAVKLLTHHKEDCSYEDYIISLTKSNNPYVIPVKRADMKDHLMREETLTDKLKNKYYPVIKYLL